MSPDKLSASDQAVSMAFTVLEAANANCEFARAYRAPRPAGYESDLTEEHALIRQADQRRELARQRFNTVVLENSIRVQGPDHPGTYVK